MSANKEAITKIVKQVVKKDLKRGCCCASGPYTNDADAAANGVPIGGIYYIADGSVKARLV